MVFRLFAAAAMLSFAASAANSRITFSSDVAPISTLIASLVTIPTTSRRCRL